MERTDETSCAAVRKATPQVRELAERYGDGVSFTFDSNGRSVLVVALFEKSAPPAVRMVPEDEVSWPSGNDDQEDGDDEGQDDES